MTMATTAPTKSRFYAHLDEGALPDHCCTTDLSSGGAFVCRICGGRESSSIFGHHADRLFRRFKAAHSDCQREWAKP